MGAKIVWRGLLVLAIDAALILLAAVLPGFTLDDGWAALGRRRRSASSMPWSGRCWPG